MIDVETLIHGRVYDPAKAHAYYERTKHLKGRMSGTVVKPVRAGSGPKVVNPGKPKHSGNQSVQAQRAALEARLEHLKEVLREKVADAKRRSGVKEPSTSSSSSSSSMKSSKSGGSSKSSSSKTEKLTAAERNQKNRKAREAYQKEKPPTIAELQRQIQSIQKQIRQAVEKDRKRHAAGSVPRVPAGSHQTADSRR